MKLSEIPETVRKLAERCEGELAQRFGEIDAVARENTRRVMEAFQEHRVSEAHLGLTTGYGYDDLGRDTLDKIYARVFGAEKALVRIGFVNGTHAIASAIYACVRPGDTLMAVMGPPYDTLRTAIGIDGNAFGSLTFYGVKYAQVDWASDGGPDYAAIETAVREKRPGAVLIQRSRGYAERKALTVPEIGRICAIVHGIDPHINVMVDNCYGEFTDTAEPTMVGADLMAGSLIKNPGGGIAPTGGYIAGRRDLVELCAYRLNAPGLGKDLGCTLDTPRDMYLGFYYAPGVVCEAIKTAIYAQCLLELVGKKPIPRYCEDHNDIVTCFDAGTADALIGFCRGVQAASPVDSYAAPEPSPEPGYTDEVIMASGSFTQGSTIELSCDGPLREPYTCYLQGGLNFAASRAGVLLAVQNAYFKE